LLPAALVRPAVEHCKGQIVPHWFTERDHPWLRALLDEYERFAGRRRTELAERLAEPLGVRCPRTKLKIAVRVLDRLLRPNRIAGVRPRRARSAAFRASAACGTREEALARAASELGVQQTEVERALFSDLPAERRVVAPGAISPVDVARESNRELVASLMARASAVRLRVWGNTRAVVRHAHCLGLICVVRAAEPKALEPLEAVEIEISGPFALFRKTELYGRALASLVPRLGWCERYELVADCALAGSAATASLIVRSGDPIAPARELARYDSRLEERFARELGKLAPDWFIVREPRPIDVGGAVIFPDFELRHRHDARRFWLVEIAGFWTARYAEHKLDALRRAGLDRLILCLDAERCCSDGELPRGARVVPYRRRIDARAVLAILESE
jgi:predicted nuclease of restriction endonuclease-like RecB superfamily